MRVKKQPKDFEIARLKIKDIDSKTATFRKTKKQLAKDKIRMRSSEVIRIVTAFNPENLKTSGSKYCYVKDLIQLQVGNSYNKYYNILCKNREEKDIGTFTLQVVDVDENNNKFVVEEIRYKRLLCGSSYVRSEKELYVKEELYNAVMKAILVGIPEDAELPKSKTAKYSTYIGLTSTDSTPVSMPNICVVKDFTKPVRDKFDIVKQIQVGKNEYKYEVKNYADTLEETEETINCFDGAGLVDYDTAAKWAKEMGLNYVPSSWQIRVSPGIKGNLYTFPIKEYIKYMEENGLQEHLTVTDLWGNKLNIKSAKINVFLTESQFKFHNLYSSFDEWKKAFVTPIEYNGHTYKRTFNISEVSKPVEKLKNRLCSAYQVLNTLKFSDEEIKSLAEPTVELTRILHTDIEEFIKFRGLYDDEDIDKADDRIPPYYKALKLNPHLKNDPYIKKKIDHDLKGFINDRYLGKLFLKGNYQTAIPDLLALMEYIVGLDVKGALSKGEVYSNYWKRKGIQKVSVWRNPHIACEWANVKVVSSSLTDKWFKYQDTGIVTDIYGTLPLRLGTMDFDGDTIATVASDIIYNAVERANVHTIRLVKEDEVSNAYPIQKQEETFRINNHRRIMEVNRLGFSNNIGEVTNKVTVLWCMYAGAETEEEKALLRDYIKIMSVVNQLIVDYVKTGVKVPIPKEIKDKIKGIKKPMFMKFKKQAASDDDKIASNADRFSFLVEERAEEEGISPEEYINIRRNFALTNCTVDKLYIYLKEQFEGIKADFYSTGNGFRFAELIKNTPNKYTLTYKAVRKKLSDLLEIHKQICEEKYYEEKNNIATDSDRRFDCFYSYCETELTKLCHNREKLLEYVIYQLYTEKEFVNCDKSILWNVFGEDICEIYRTGNINTSPEKITQLEKKRLKAEKNAEKVKALRKGSTIVSIKDLPEGEITVTDTEVSYISDIVEENQTYLRLAVVLLALYRKINLENVKKPKPINLEKGQKNRVTINQLCKLSDIYHRQIDKGFELLENKNLIHIDISSLKTPKISVNMPRLEKTVKEYTIEDINEVGEIFSDQNISAS